MAVLAERYDLRCVDAAPGRECQMDRMHRTHEHEEVVAEAGDEVVLHVWNLAQCSNDDDYEEENDPEGRVQARWSRYQQAGLEGEDERRAAVGYGETWCVVRHCKEFLQHLLCWVLLIARIPYAEAMSPRNVTFRI